MVMGEGTSSQALVGEGTSSLPVVSPTKKRVVMKKLTPKKKKA
jgi:hypothetical protein